MNEYRTSDLDFIAYLYTYNFREVAIETYAENPRIKVFIFDNENGDIDTFKQEWEKSLFKTYARNWKIIKRSVYSTIDKPYK